MTTRVLVCCAAFVALLAGVARADVQTLHIPAPGWHFVSLDVEPDASAPEAVFPVGGGFAWDQLWGFDPVDGWRHYTPGSLLPDALDDLEAIEALRGYWIHVTATPVGGIDLAVTGTNAVGQRLDPPPASAEGWHAIGPLLPEGATLASVATTFAALGSSLPLTLLEVWRYDAASGQLAPIIDYGADCGTEPDACLERGRGYWLRADGSIVLGIVLDASSEAIVLEGDAPVAPIQIRYEGSLPVVARLRALDADAGMGFVGTRPVILDGVELAEPDSADDPAGPDANIDLDGDGTAQPCPDACAGAPACVSLCFADGGQSHTLYAGVDLATRVDATNFAPSRAGYEHTQLALEFVELGTTPGGPPPAPLSGPLETARIRVGLRPSPVLGLWAGALQYDAPSPVHLPLSLWIDDCHRDFATATEVCDGGRAIGLINGSLSGSRVNGRDDDADGDIDEPLEDRIVRRRDTPGVPAETPLRGSISSDGLSLRLAGAIGQAALAFARPRCLPTGTCAGSATACASDAQCPAPPDAGLARAGLASLRELSLSGVRTRGTQFVGAFSDLYGGVSIDGGTFARNGTFTLAKVTAPVCIVPSDVPGASPLVLDVSCRSDADCPGRCRGPAAIDGLPCYDDEDAIQTQNPNADCAGVLASTGAAVFGTCERLVCDFPMPASACASGPSAGVACSSNADCGGNPCAATQSRLALDHASGQVQLTGLDRPALVSASGAEDAAVLLSPGASSADLGPLACGSYQIEVIAPGCAPFIASYDPCIDPPLAIGALSCTGPPDLPQSLPVASSDGAFTLYGAPVAGGALSGGALSGRAVAGDSAPAARAFGEGWTNLLSWPDVLVAIRAGLLEVL